MNIKSSKNLKSSKGKNTRCIFYLCNHATYFASHRLQIARTLVQSGTDVYLYCGSKRLDESKIHSELRKENINLFIKRHSAGSTNIVSFIWFIIQFMAVASKIKPDVVHCISIKAVIVGLLYSTFFRKTNVVIAISGLGSIFTLSHNQSIFSKFRQIMVLSLLKVFTALSPRVKYIVQNHDDKLFLESKLNILSKNISLIQGSGAKILDFTKCCPFNKDKKVLMASRILVNKGVEEYLMATKNLKKKYPDWEFFLAGVIDADSPAAFNEAVFYKLLSQSSCNYLGYVESMNKLLNDISIFVLPSYREGFPKAVIEAGLAGCAIVTTDVPGCRDAILNGSVGILVKPKNSTELEKGIAALIGKEKMRIEMASSMQEHARQNFGIENIVNKHIQIYESF
jgi:glycosyltransferase involved in cell wall biosynthesis